MTNYPIAQFRLSYQSTQLPNYPILWSQLDPDELILALQFVPQSIDRRGQLFAVSPSLRGLARLSPIGEQSRQATHDARPNLVASVHRGSPITQSPDSPITQSPNYPTTQFSSRH